MLTLLLLLGYPVVVYLMYRYYNTKIELLKDRCRKISDWKITKPNNVSSDNVSLDKQSYSTYPSGTWPITQYTVENTSLDYPYTSYKYSKMCEASCDAERSGDYEKQRDDLITKFRNNKYNTMSKNEMYDSDESDEHQATGEELMYKLKKFCDRKKYIRVNDTNLDVEFEDPIKGWCGDRERDSLNNKFKEFHELRDRLAEQRKRTMNHNQSMEPVVA